MILARFRLAGIGYTHIIAISHMSRFLFVFNYLTVFVGKLTWHEDYSKALIFQSHKESTCFRKLLHSHLQMRRTLLHDKKENQFHMHQNVDREHES